LSNVGKAFRVHGRLQTVLDRIDLTIARGEVFGIVGASGAGKSTLIRLINRLERPSHGTVEVGGDDLSRLSARQLSAKRQKIGMIFQQFGLLSSKTARQNVLYALELAGSGTLESRRAKVDALLERVGLAPHADKYPAQLSGGQKQRVGIARALANDPEILLCDEATSALDPESTAEILALLDELNRTLGLTIVVVTHEMDVVRRACDRVAILDHGKLVEVGAVAQVLFQPRTEAARTLGRFLLPHPPGNGAERLRLTYFADLVQSDVLSAATKGLDASLAILAGQVAQLKSGSYADLIVAIDGSDRGVAIGRLRKRGVDIAESVS
jgi:ABC-type metal ion transport system, ATPase component